MHNVRTKDGAKQLSEVTDLVQLDLRETFQDSEGYCAFLGGESHLISSH